MFYYFINRLKFLFYLIAYKVCPRLGKQYEILTKKSILSSIRTNRINYIKFTFLIEESIQNCKLITRIIYQYKQRLMVKQYLEIIKTKRYS